MSYTPQELKQIMSSGLLSFPVTDFDANGDFDRAGYVRRLEWLGPYGASALFAAGGTGEFFSLTGAEYPEIIKTAVDTCFGKVPIIAGAGGPTRFAIEQSDAVTAVSQYLADETRLVFGVPFEGSPLAFIVGFNLFIVVNLALGFLISTAARSTRNSMATRSSGS